MTVGDKGKMKSNSPQVNANKFGEGSKTNPKTGDESPSTSHRRKNGRSSSWSLSSVSLPGTPTSTSSQGGSSSADKFKRSDPEIIFCKPLEPRHECPVCGQVLRYPVQFEECGHRCCSSCLSQILRVAPRCPIDQSHVEKEKCYPDKAFQRELESLPVRCYNTGRGCQWSGPMRSLTEHTSECEYVLMTCPQGCGVEFEKRFKSRHWAEDCPRRPIKCQFCRQVHLYEEELDHLNVCPRVPVPCPNRCKKREIPREQLNEHLESCSKQKTKCPFTLLGCDHKGTRKEVDKHLKDDIVAHLKIVSDILLQHGHKLEDNANAIDNQDERMVTIEKNISSLEKLYGSQLVWKISDYKDKYQQAKDGTKTTIYSPTFMTSRHGYTMVMSACLYGDGKSRGKQMSLFVCLCKGDYDPLLQWPFCAKVVFTLLDQGLDPASRRNITYTIKPNPVKANNVFLGRPTLDRNPSFGTQKFAELSEIEKREYVKDDTMYIKVDVEITNLPKL